MEGFYEEAGFSLVETMIAMVVCSIGILGILGFNVVILASNSLTGSAVNAQTLAQAQLENLLLLPMTAAELSPCAGGLGDFCHVDMGSGLMGQNTSAAALDLEGKAAANGQFYREWSVANVGGANPWVLRVRIRWVDMGLGTNPQTKSHSLILSTTL